MYHLHYRNVIIIYYKHVQGVPETEGGGREKKNKKKLRYVICMYQPSPMKNKKFIRKEQEYSKIYYKVLNLGISQIYFSIFQLFGLSSSPETDDLA